VEEIIIYCHRLEILSLVGVVRITESILVSVLEKTLISHAADEQARVFVPGEPFEHILCVRESLKMGYRKVPN
jgi:hypothetical protein